MARVPSEHWKGELYKEFFEQAADTFDPDTEKLEHSQLARKLILEAFGGSMPCSIWPYRPGDNYPDPLAKGRSGMVASGEGSGDLYAPQKGEAGGRLSVFEGALAKDLIRLFSNPGDLVLDPFAGRATRLNAALDLDRSYAGFDLSQDAIDCCESVIVNHDNGKNGEVFHQNALELGTYFGPDDTDMVMTCPPYGWSEFYGDNQEGLETTPNYHAFVEELAAILLLAGSTLKKGRYMVVVVRGWYSKGHFYDVPSHLERYMSAGGYKLAEHDVHKMSTNRERFHMDVVRWRRAAQVHESVLVWQKDEPKDTRMEAIHQATLDQNTSRNDAALSLVRRRIIEEHTSWTSDALLPIAPRYGS